MQQKFANMMESSKIWEIVLYHRMGWYLLHNSITVESVQVENHANSIKLKTVYPTIAVRIWQNIYANAILPRRKGKKEKKRRQWNFRDDLHSNNVNIIWSKNRLLVGLRFSHSHLKLRQTNNTSRWELKKSENLMPKKFCYSASDNHSNCSSIWYIFVRVSHHYHYYILNCTLTKEGSPLRSRAKEAWRITYII